MANESLNCRLVILVAVFSLFSVLLGVFALTFNYWTYNGLNGSVSNGTSTTDLQSYEYYYKGLFKECKENGTCVNLFQARVFVVCLLGMISLSFGGIFSFINFPKIADRRYLLTSVVIFVGCALMTAGLIDYASISLLNYYCSYTMIVAIIFAYAALPISAFSAGQYSASERSIFINNENHDSQKYSTTNGNGL